jgi:uncharacterized protein YbjT (DUF2867 family)
MLVIAGVSGRTGGVVADALLARGEKVRVVVRDATKASRWRDRGAEVAVASLADPGALAEALGGSRGFFALLPEDPSVADFHGHREAMARAMGAAVASARVPHVVFLSALAAALARRETVRRETCTSPRGRCARPARIVTTVRATYFQENVLAVLPAARHEGIYPTLLPSAGPAFPTVASRDVARLAVSCLLEPPAASEIIDVLGPAYTVPEMAQELGRALGRRAAHRRRAAAAHVEALLPTGMPRSFAEAVAELFACLAAGRVRRGAIASPPARRRSARPSRRRSRRDVYGRGRTPPRRRARAERTARATRSWRARCGLRARDEVPVDVARPVEIGAAEQHDARRLERLDGGAGALAEDQHDAAAMGDAVQLHRAVDDVERPPRVLAGELELGAAVERGVDVEERRGDVHRGGGAVGRAGHQPEARAWPLDLGEALGRVVLEAGVVLLARPRQGHPELQAVEVGAALALGGRRALGVDDAAPGVHPVDRAGADGCSLPTLSRCRISPSKR